MNNPATDLEVQFKPETGKAVIEGKTSVPFGAFVTLVLQRKVQQLNKSWGKDPIIVNSELLTALASAPQDSAENRQNLILVSLLTGGIIGVALFCVLQSILLFLDFPLFTRELLIIAGSIAVVAGFLALLMKLRKLPRGEKLSELMEGLAGFLR